jgi:hypothetical protein
LINSCGGLVTDVAVEDQQVERVPFVVGFAFDTGEDFASGECAFGGQ